jgi:hypothetical protein
MSRNWERMVRKNTKAANKNRLKQGIPLISDRDQPQLFKGRSTLLTLLCLVVFIFLIVNSPQAGQDNMSLFTMASYFILGLFVFFVRRPYLKVNKASLAKRGFIKEYILYAENIKQITAKPGYVFVEQKGKQRWVYSKILNRFKVDEMASKLKSFSEQNHVTFVDERSLN